MENGFYLSFPLFIKWSITGRCNLRCRHCFLSSYASEPSLNTIKEIIDLFEKNKVVSVVLTGGEPLLRPDIAEIVAMLAKASIRTVLATNGTLLTENLAKAFADNGLKQCQISLDGHDKFTHDNIRGEGTFEKALNAVAALKKTNIRVVLGHTLNTDNARHALKMIKLAETSGADTLRYELFLPIRETDYPVQYN